jgi:hypothetical protein
MARIFREASGGWGVQGVGAFCQGDTTGNSLNYVDAGDADPSGMGGMIAGIRALRL